MEAQMSNTAASIDTARMSCKVHHYKDLSNTMICFVKPLFDTSIPNFKNFVSLHSVVQSLAEQKHALEISEHTLIIMCNNKAGYNSYSKMTKRTYTAQHSGKFGGRGQTLTRGLS